MIQVRITRNGKVTTQPVHSTERQKTEVLESYRTVASMIRGVTIEDIWDETSGELIGFSSTTSSGNITRLEVLEIEAEVEEP